MNHKVDDGNETILSLFPLPPITKYRLRGRGWVWLRSLAKSAKSLHPPPSRPDFLPKIGLINTPTLRRSSPVSVHEPHPEGCWTSPRASRPGQTYLGSDQIQEPFRFQVGGQPMPHFAPVFIGYMGGVDAEKLDPPQDEWIHRRRKLPTPCQSTEGDSTTKRIVLRR